MITEQDLTQEQMKDAANREYCGQCGGNLSMAWGGAHGVNGYILRCGNDIQHNTITRHKQKSDYESKIENEFRRVQKMDSKALTTMTENQMLTRISSAKFPQELTQPDRKALALAAITYGFDPLMGEISIFQGRPFVSIDGRYRKAQETGKLDGVRTRPATKEEREQWEIPVGDYFFLAEVYVKGSSMPFQGWGRIRAAEINSTGKFKPVDTNPQRMAEKRAEAQALRKAFHINLPSMETIGTEDEDPAPVVFNGRKVVETTGEIIDQSLPEPSPDAPEAKTTAPTPTTNPPIPKVSDKTYKALLDAKDNAVVTNAGLVAEVASRGWTAKSAKELTEPQAEQIIKWLKGKVGQKTEEDQIPF